MNQFREWLSDNLRYILLVLGVLAVLLALFFGVRAISSRLGDGGSAGTSAETESAVSQPAVPSVSPTATPTPTPAVTYSPLSDAPAPEVSEVVESYYEALSKQDLAAIRELTDTLPEEEAARISASGTVYSDVKNYVKPGPNPDVNIVYTYYHYLNANQPEELPGLSQMVVKRGADNKWKIIYSELDKETADYIAGAGADKDVADLIAKVREEYEAVVNAAGSGEEAEAGTETEEGTEAGTDTAEGTEAGTDTAEGAETGTETAEGAEAGTETAEGAEAGTETAEGAEAGTETAEEAASAAETAEEENAGTQEEAAEEETEEEEAAPSESTSAVNASCNIRSGPGYDYDVIGSAGAGQSVTVIGGLEDGWWHIRAGGVEGYIGKPFLS